VFITLEGIEGCGKSTQISRLAQRLRGLFIPTVVTLEPGGTGPGRAIRKILLDPANKGLTPLAELLLYEADRAQHVETLVAPALKAGRWVLCDRFFDATTVYQGFAREQDLEFVQMLNQRATGGIRPDRTFVLDCPVSVGLKRALQREASRNAGQSRDRFERESLAFHEKIREGYLQLAAGEPDRFVVVDAAQEPSAVHEAIFNRIAPWINRGSGAIEADTTSGEKRS
jgi:dTMP kinase